MRKGEDGFRGGLLEEGKLTDREKLSLSFRCCICYWGVLVSLREQLGSYHGSSSIWLGTLGTEGS